MRQVGDRGVEGQVAFQEQSGCLPFLCDHGKSVIHGVMGIAEIDQPPFVVNPACRSCPYAEHGLEQFSPSCADQSVQAEDFSFPYIKSNILQIRLKFRGKMFNIKNHIARFIVHRRETVVQGPADHRGDQLIHVGFFGFLCQDHLSVPHHGNFIADLKDLIHFMGDIDQRDPLRLQVAHHLEQFGDFLHRQGGCGFVEYDQPGVVGDRFGNLHHLAC